MKIIFLRHAIAVEVGTKGYVDDFKRPLTHVGRKKMRQIAQGMLTMGLSFDLIFSSPYIRTKETAKIVSDTFKIKENTIIYTQNLTPDASFEKLLQEVSTYLKKDITILLVGHEPFLSELISFYLTGQRKVAIDLKKGSLCQLSLDKPSLIGRATLNWLLTPSQLRQIKPNIH